MPRAHPVGEPPREIVVAGTAFALGARPDPPDGRDHPYRPGNPALPPAVGSRLGPRVMVLTQTGPSSVGYALAAVLGRRLGRGPGQEVSPHMLGALARRYDPFPGSPDAGRSLRAALRGWSLHGVASAEVWPGPGVPGADLDGEAFRRACASGRPGDFLRVDVGRLPQMRAALAEFGALAVSVDVHPGWAAPTVLRHGEGELHVISRPPGAEVLGVHAVALVGWDEAGFLVQNSWGPGWGEGGYAILPYGDWLEHAHDAWAVRPGPEALPGGWSVPLPGGERLARHVVNLGNDGRLSRSGRFVSSEAQVRGVVEAMTRFHARQPQAHVLLYAHGGLVEEGEGLRTAGRQLQWWLNNGVYPVTLVWQSGPGETLLSALADLLQPRLAAETRRLDLTEITDGLVEGLARRTVRPLWNEMKENARGAGDPVRNSADPPGGTLLLHLLREAGRGPTYRRKPLRLHLAGHSAGSVLLTGLLPRVRDLGLRVTSLHLLAPALRMDEFGRDVLPHLGPRGRVGRPAVFNLTDTLERDDTSGVGAVTPYHKSVLYLVARALETPGEETPLVGLTKYAGAPLLPGGRSLREVLAAAGGGLATPESPGGPDAWTTARRHIDFDEDVATMTSVLLRVLGTREITPGRRFQPDAPPVGNEGRPAPGGEETQG